MIDYPLPVLGFAALSGTGKTMLLCKLLPQLKARGLRVGIIKRAHHDFDTDIPGKDSYELRKAGATQTLVASRQRWALITETDHGPEPQLDELLQRLDHDRLDLVLVEGFKKESFPKIELYRPSLGQPPRYRADRTIIAIATDGPIAEEVTIPILDLNRPEQIVDFILQMISGDDQNRNKAGIDA